MNILAYLKLIPNGEYKNYISYINENNKKKFDNLIVFKREVFNDRRGCFTQNFNKKKILKIIKNEN